MEQRSQSLLLVYLSSLSPFDFFVVAFVDFVLGFSIRGSQFAVASRSIEKASIFAKANKFPPEAKIYGSYEALLDDPDIDVVYLPLPTLLHVKWAVVVMQKKKHLLMEKPVALNVTEIDVIVKACEENGVQFMD
ncbi:hypothetical protein Ddye_012466 [Dipteronia dyeriana]|uniref:Gfo/Idh/MocA-like oxidoreductase N-terminal domain-containing protein n=1 Tax=Dipteronia dyeriana TaxID=168575 RepID=A0AAD9X4I6_9ROSI|nr:hypothetical protein Ddye_012466 [Dipteronia dyeriana]